VTWSYSGNPASSDKDEVRFLTGDTCEKEGLILDEEINYAVANQSSNILAAALVLRSLAARYSRVGTVSVGDVYKSGDTIATKYSARADELDPYKLTIAAASLVMPSFGGDRDQSFTVGMNDIEGGPSDADRS